MECLWHLVAGVLNYVCSIFFAICAVVVICAVVDQDIINIKSRELFSPLVTKEKECHCSRSGMGTNGGADIIDDNFAIHIFKAFFY